MPFDQVIFRDYEQPCNCHEGDCRLFVSPPDTCVNRLSGEVKVQHCDACDAGTWHHNGNCLRCKRRQNEPV
jgi:hypothetical protein